MHSLTTRQPASSYKISRSSLSLRTILSFLSYPLFVTRSTLVSWLQYDIFNSDNFLTRPISVHWGFLISSLESVGIKPVMYTVLKQSIRQSRVTALAESTKCHTGHTSWGQVMKCSNRSKKIKIFAITLEAPGRQLPDEDWLRHGKLLAVNNYKLLNAIWTLEKTKYRHLV